MHRLRWLACSAVLLAAFLSSTATASASHFRAGQLSWHKTGAQSVEFTLTASFRRDGYNGTASDGYPAVGDVIDEYIGATQLNFGDGSRAYDDTTGELSFRVTAINPSENYLVAVAIDPSDPTHQKTTITHTYPTAGRYTAEVQSCCTIEDEKNNPSGDYNVSSVVDLSQDSSSPVSSLQPIVVVGDNGMQTFRVPGLAPANRTLHYRLATPTEACDTGCVGDSNPPGLEIDPDTGEVTWDTSLAWSNAADGDGLWFASVVLEARDGNANVTSTDQVTFLMQVVNAQSIPVFGGSSSDAPATPIPYDPNAVPGSDGNTPPDGTQFFADATKTISIQLSATAPDPNSVLHIDSLGLPTGGTLTSHDGNPATAVFSWTPTTDQTGDQLVSFTVTNTVSSSIRPQAARVSVVERGHRYLLRPSVTSGSGGGQTISYTFKVVNDSTPPTTTATPQNCSSTGTVLFKSTDAGSGVAKILASVEGGALMTAEPNDRGEAMLSVIADGVHTVHFYAVDNAGNQEAAQSVSFVTDNSTPSVAITSLQSQTAYLLDTLGSIAVSAADPVGLSVDPSSASEIIATDQLGSHTVTRSATDLCGHVGTSSFTYHVDAAPASTHAPTPAPTPAPKPAACAALKGHKLTVCHATQVRRTALARCKKDKAKERVACVKAANGRYHVAIKPKKSHKKHKQKH